MALAQLFQEAMTQNDFEGEHINYFEKWQSDAASVTSSDDYHSGGFDCNICLDSVQEPVVTLCGHLFCWPCIYKWLHSQSVSSENQYQQQLQCPVCKAQVSQATLVPLYGRSQATNPPKSKAPNLGIVIPRRPLGPVCGFDIPSPPSAFSSPPLTQQLHDQSYSQQAQHLGSYTTSMLNLSGTSASLAHPIMGMLEEMVNARVFGNSVTNVYSNSYHLAGSNSPRVRRYVMEADRCLSRICLFFLCSTILCLVLF